MNNTDLLQSDAKAEDNVPRKWRTITFVTVVLPCLNEQEAVGKTVQEAIRGLRAACIDGEVLVVDNGSTDDSAALAAAAGARVIGESKRGYGAAHLAGIAAAQGDVVVMADADCTYDLERIGALLQPLDDGADLVVGSRLQGTVHAGAMPFLHRRLGTPTITALLRLLTGVGISDSQSGYRAFRVAAVRELDLRSPGMEYASEMLLRAGRAGWVVRDVPSDYRARVGESKLNTLGDGWRHLRMLLILSPHLTLLLPGIAMLAFGILLSSFSWIASKGVELGSLRWQPQFLGPALMIIGAESLLLGGLAAQRSELTPHVFRDRVAFLVRPDAVNRLLRTYAGIVCLGLTLNFLLIALWLAGASAAVRQPVAAYAQAGVVIGVMGILTVLAADFARDSLWHS